MVSEPGLNFHFIHEEQGQCQKPSMPWLRKWDPSPSDTAEQRRQKWITREQFIFFTPCLAQSRSSFDCQRCADRFRRSVEEPPKGAWAP